jgi:transposase
MALFVGLDVSLRFTSICVVEADGSAVWEGKAESEPAPLIKALMRWRESISDQIPRRSEMTRWANSRHRKNI